MHDAAYCEGSSREWSCWWCHRQPGRHLLPLSPAKTLPDAARVTIAPRHCCLAARVGPVGNLAQPGKVLFDCCLFALSAWLRCGWFGYWALRHCTAGSFVP